MLRFRNRVIFIPATGLHYSHFGLITEKLKVRIFILRPVYDVHLIPLLIGPDGAT